MPGREIKGTSKIANYRHGGRAGFKSGNKVYKKDVPGHGPHQTTAGKKAAVRHLKKSLKD